MINLDVSHEKIMFKDLKFKDVVLKFAISKIAFVLYAMLIIWASLKSGGGPRPIEHFDKVMHFVSYGMFAVIAAGCTRYKKTFIQLCLLIIVYGALMEFFQSFVPPRFMSFADFVANTSGVIVVVLVVLRLKIHQ